MNDPTPGPWRVSIEKTPSGESVKILGANGTVVALVKAAGGAKHVNAEILAAAWSLSSTKSAN
jgi:hypothetical protein